MNYLLNQHKRRLSVGGTAFSEHGRTLFAPTDVCGVIKGCEINNNAKCQGGWAVEGASPYRLLGEVCCAAKSLSLFAGVRCAGG